MSDILYFLYWGFYWVFMSAISIFFLWMIVMLFIGGDHDGDDGRGT